MSSECLNHRTQKFVIAISIIACANLHIRKWSNGGVPIQHFFTFLFKLYGENIVNFSNLHIFIIISMVSFFPLRIMPGSGQNRSRCNLTLSDWVTSIRSLIRKRICHLRRSTCPKVRSIFNDKLLLKT